MELAQRHTQNVGNVENPRDIVIANFETLRAVSTEATLDGGEESPQSSLMDAENALHRIGDDAGEHRQHAECECQSNRDADGRQRTRRRRKHAVPEAAESGSTGRRLAAASVIASANSAIGPAKVPAFEAMGTSRGKRCSGT